MDLPEMHVWFRQYAQQMGMQNVRAILPEQIDVLINTSISDTVNEIIRTNIGLTNDRIITDNAKLGQINALRTLYDTIPLAIGSSGTVTPDSTNGNLHVYNCSNFINYLVNTHNMLYVVDFAIDYRKGTSSDKTYRYPVRAIDNMYLADTLQDFVMKPRFRSPIIVVDGGNLYLYLGDNDVNVIPSTLYVGILKKPAKVKYLEDVTPGSSINCNLPDYMHVEILKHAVDLYRVAIQGSLYANQQQQQAQQREIGRNNVRPDNEGYQQ